MNDIDRADKRFSPAIAGDQEIFAGGGMGQPFFLAGMKLDTEN